MYVELAALPSGPYSRFVSACCRVPYNRARGQRAQCAVYCFSRRQNGPLPCQILPDVKTSWPQQAGCCTVSSGPLFQSIRHRRKRIVVSSLLFAMRQHLFQSGFVSSRYLLPG